MTQEQKDRMDDVIVLAQAAAAKLAESFTEFLAEVRRLVSEMVVPHVPDNTHLRCSDMAHPPFNVDDIAVGDVVRVRGETLYFWVVSVDKETIFARGILSGGICQPREIPKNHVTDYFHPDPRSEARWISRPTKFNDEPSGH